MTDREILDQLEQWLKAELVELGEIATSCGLSDIGIAHLEQTNKTLDKLRELRDQADDPGLADWLTERAQSTSPSQPIGEFLNTLDDE
jgi:hypothetical protein